MFAAYLGVMQKILEKKILQNCSDVSVSYGVLFTWLIKNTMDKTLLIWNRWGRCVIHEKYWQSCFISIWLRWPECLGSCTNRLQLIGINLMWRVYFLEIAVGDQTQSCNILLSTMLTRRDSVENVWTSLLARFHTAASHGQNSWGSVGNLNQGLSYIYLA